MKSRIFLAMALIGLAVFLIGCSKSGTNYDGYATYQQGQPQGQYVGGGCGVAPQDDYENTPSVDSVTGL